MANGEIKNIVIVGTGVIRASWAAYYLSRGFNMIATDPTILLGSFAIHFDMAPAFYIIGAGDW